MLSRALSLEMFFTRMTIDAGSDPSQLMQPSKVPSAPIRKSFVSALARSDISGSSGAEDAQEAARTAQITITGME
jgi:hypothetical protein